MSLLEFPIRRYPFTLILFVCLAVLGWFAFALIAREEDKRFKITVLTINAIYQVKNFFVFVFFVVLFFVVCFFQTPLSNKTPTYP